MKEIYTFSNAETGPIHADMNHPFCQELRERLKLAAAAARVELHDGGCVACVSGPQFETRAQAEKLFEHADLVGMTTGPEALLAREKGLHYCPFLLVTNYAPNVETGEEKGVSHEGDVLPMVDKMRGQVLKIFEVLLPSMSEDVSKLGLCHCRRT
jgi:purine nucleoside phosphorylase